MKKLTLLGLVCFCLAVSIAQEATNKNSQPKERNGNAEAMRRNLNYPDAVNPARHNNQRYDRGTGRIENDHPEKSLSNSYTNRRYLEEKKQKQ